MRSPFRLRVVGGGERHQALLTWLQLECLPHDDPADTSTGHWWVAYENGNPAAFGGLVASQRDTHGGYLCRAGVLPQYRGFGLQRKLISVRVRKARSLGMRTLYTDTFCNPQSSNNLIAAGFRMYDPRIKYGLPHASYWRRDLTK